MLRYLHLLMVLKEVDKLQYQLVQQVLDRVDHFYLHLVQVLVLVKVLEALILSPVEAVLALVDSFFHSFQSILNVVVMYSGIILAIGCPPLATAAAAVSQAVGQVINVHKNAVTRLVTVGKALTPTMFVGPVERKEQ